jgi:phosphopentomutase
MQTYSVNSLAEQFEIDRGTMVRALKNVAPDAEKTPGRPTFKLSTASRALEAHRRSIGRVPARPTKHTAASNEIDPRLQRHYDAFDQADASMRRLKTVEARRQAAIGMGPQIAKMDALQRQISLDNGIDQELTDLRCDQLFFLYLRGFEGPCNWLMSEVWAACDVRE